MRFANAPQATEFEMPKWVIYAMLCSSVDQLKAGLPLRRLSGIIKAKHPRKREVSNTHIMHVLHSASSLQIKNGLRPIVMDYDAAEARLDFVDRDFLIWLSIQDVAELMDEFALPEPLDFNAPEIR